MITRASALILILLSFGSAAARAQTPSIVLLMKLALHEQRSDGGPTALGFGVGAQANFPAATPSNLTVTLVKPNGTQVLPRISPSSFNTLEIFTSRAAMDAQFPDGAYAFRLGGATNLSYNLNLASPAVFGAPFITNFTAAQAIASPSNFTLTWAPVVGARASDVMVIAVESLDGTHYFSSADPGEDGALSGTSTQLPLNLPPNQQFTVDLMYFRVSDITASTNAMAGFAVMTRFSMRTLGGQPPPVMSTQPTSRAVTVNDSTTFTAVASGTGPFTYQWRLNGADLPSATRESLTLPNVQSFQAGNYTVEIRNSGGAATSNAALLTVAPRSTAGSNARLVNLATRGQAGSGPNALIPGFVLSGTGTKRVLIRAVGPTLTDFGLAAAEVVADPTISLVSTATGATLATNDDWHQGDVGAISTATTAAGGFALPTGSRDAVILTTLSAGSYTALVSGKTGDAGLAIVEVYDLDGPASDLRLVNIATRGLVGRDTRVLIPGFVVAGDAPKTYLIRGVGPTLAIFNQTGILTDPVLTVFQGSTELFTNDDWSSASNAAQVAAAARSAGAFDLLPNGRDAALLVTLRPGAYTFQVAGKATATGIALVEVYEVP